MEQDKKECYILGMWDAQLRLLQESENITVSLVTPTEGYSQYYYGPCNKFTELADQSRFWKTCMYISETSNIH